MLRVLAKVFQQRADCTATFIGNHYGNQFIDLAKELGISENRLTILPEIPLLVQAGDENALEKQLNFMINHINRYHPH